MKTFLFLRSLAFVRHIEARSSACDGRSSCFSSRFLLYSFFAQFLYGSSFCMKAVFVWKQILYGSGIVCVSAESNWAHLSCLQSRKMKSSESQKHPRCFWFCNEQCTTVMSVFYHPPLCSDYTPLYVSLKPWGFMISSSNFLCFDNMNSLKDTA